MTNRLDILIVEDEPFQREMLREFLKNTGHRVFEAESGESALELVHANAFDLLLLDFRMRGMDGLATLRSAKAVDPGVDAVIMTAYGAIETAVEAMKSGAADYITKPIDFDELTVLIQRITEHRTLVRENEILRQELQERSIASDTIQYKSREMAELMQLAGRIAASEATVMIQGETGTGKELTARLIHQLSGRSARPFVAVNCAAIPENLVESEFFGHEKGAFTGAVRRRIGRFEQADGGTLFLDEVGELSMTVQVKLLRFLQEREFQRVGGDKTMTADVRIISATHRNLEDCVRAGAFREDMFYRLHVVVMRIPPLRERRDDIPLLVRHFIGYYGEKNHKEIKGVSREAMNVLLRYDYPGNVRELKNIIERAVVIARDTVIATNDLPFQKSPAEELEAGALPAPSGTLRQSVAMLERQMIQEAMEDAGGHQSRAALRLGLSERMLRYKLKKYHLSVL